MRIAPAAVEPAWGEPVALPLPSCAEHFIAFEDLQRGFRGLPEIFALAGDFLRSAGKARLSAVR